MFAQLAGAEVKKIDSGHLTMLSKSDEILAMRPRREVNEEGVLHACAW